MLWSWILYGCSEQAIQNHQVLSFTTNVYIMRAILADAATMAERSMSLSSSCSFLEAMLPPFFLLKKRVTGESSTFLTCPMVACISSHLAWGSPFLVIPQWLTVSEESSPWAPAPGRPLLMEETVYISVRDTRNDTRNDTIKSDFNQS